MSIKASTPEDLDVTAVTDAGNTYHVAVYVDPCPGRHGDEILKETCGKCGGSRVVGYGNVTLVQGGVEDRFCFECNGRGYTTRLVSSARSTARRQVKAENERRAAAADFAATADERLAAEILEAHTEALAEQARRAALVTGFLAEEGVRVRNLKATVKVNHQFETTDFYGRLDFKTLLILEAEDGKAIKAVVPYAKCERGQEVTITGTVKAHTSYEGQDQTVLQRVIIK